MIDGRERPLSTADLASGSTARQASQEPSAMPLSPPSTAATAATRPFRSTSWPLFTA